MPSRNWGPSHNQLGALLGQVCVCLFVCFVQRNCLGGGRGPSASALVHCVAQSGFLVPLLVSPTACTKSVILSVEGAGRGRSPARRCLSRSLCQFRPHPHCRKSPSPGFAFAALGALTASGLKSNCPIFRPSPTTAPPPQCGMARRLDR